MFVKYSLVRLHVTANGEVRRFLRRSVYSNFKTGSDSDCSDVGGRTVYKAQYTPPTPTRTVELSCVGDVYTIRN